MSKPLHHLRHCLRCLLHKNNNVWSRNLSSRRVKLNPIGQCQTPYELDKPYECGQFFLHKTNRYRGIIMYPCLVKPHDADVKSEEIRQDNPDVETSKTVTDRGHYYYQVLMSYVDWGVNKQSHPDMYTNLELSGEKITTEPYQIWPVYDAVSHEDIIPYTSEDRDSVVNLFVDLLMEYDETKCPPFSAKKKLQTMQERSSNYLNLSKLLKETTENIRVTVIPFFISTSHKGTEKIPSFTWTYYTRLENISDEPVKIKERGLKLFKNNGTLNTLNFRSTVGKEPVLSAQSPTIQYCHRISFEYPSGYMWGTVKMEKKDGSTFDVRIPPLALESINEPDIESPYFHLNEKPVIWNGNLDKFT